MIEFIKTKKNYILALSVLFVMVSLSDPTYSLFLKSESTEKFNYNTGLLDLQFVEDEQISIENAFPIIDSEGIKQEPYKLTIKNTGSLPYLFDLKMLSSTDEEVIDTKYIKFQVNSSIPTTLYQTSGVIASNLILYPNEELSFNVKVWLDNSAPNSILGKKFNAKIVTEGTSIYRTLDASGANHPNLNNKLISVYYDEKNKVWKKADDTNISTEYEWYNYDNGKWANSVDIKESNKIIFDITNNYNLKNSDFEFNDGNIIIDDNTCEITYSESQDKIIKVPEEISGRKVVGIGKFSFTNNKITEYIILPDTVEYIENSAFVNDDALRYIDFGKNLKKIGYGAFNYVNLETVDFPEGMETINASFGFADNLKEVYIPSSVTNITKIASIKITPNIVIVTPAGSKAEEIAKRDGLPVRNK